MAGGAAERNATADASPQGAAASEYVEHELKLTLDLLSFTLTASKPAAAAAATTTTAVAASAGSAAPAAAAPEVFDAETAALLRAAGAEAEAAAPAPAVGAAAAAAAHDFARLSLLGFEVVLAKRPAGLRSEGSLHSVEMYDLNAEPGALGHALVRPAPATGQETGTAAAAAAAAAAGAEGAPQWRFRYEQNPPHRTEERELSLLVTSPLELVHNAALLSRIYTFFAVAGESERAALAKIVSDAVTQTLTSWREETLSALLARHQTTALDIRLAAPRLLLPENLHDPAAGVLVLDMGAIRMTSAMQPQQAEDVGAQAALAAAAAAAAAGGADLLELSTSIEPAASALYDRYDLEVSSTQLLLAPAAANWRSAQVQVQQRLHLVYQFGVSLQLHTCILPPDSHPFQHFVVSGALSKAGAPSLNVRLSTAQLRKLNAILDAAFSPAAVAATVAATTAAAAVAAAATTPATPGAERGASFGDASTPMSPNPRGSGTSAVAATPSSPAATAAPASAAPASAVALRVSGGFQLQNIMLMLSDPDTFTLEWNLYITLRADHFKIKFFRGVLSIETNLRR